MKSKNFFEEKEHAVGICGIITYQHLNERKCLMFMFSHKQDLEWLRKAQNIFNSIKEDCVRHVQRDQLPNRGGRAVLQRKRGKKTCGRLRKGDGSGRSGNRKQLLRLSHLTAESPCSTPCSENEGSQTAMMLEMTTPKQTSGSSKWVLLGSVPRNKLLILVFKWLYTISANTTTFQKMQSNLFKRWIQALE